MGEDEIIFRQSSGRARATGTSWANVDPATDAYSPFAPRKKRYFRGAKGDYEPQNSR